MFVGFVDDLGVGGVDVVFFLCFLYEWELFYELCCVCYLFLYCFVVDLQCCGEFCSYGVCGYFFMIGMFCLFGDLKCQVGFYCQDVVVSSLQMVDCVFDFDECFGECCECIYLFESCVC